MKIAPLLRDDRFEPFFWTMSLGALNDNILKNGLVILIAFKSLTVFGVPSAQMIALCAGIFILPFFLFSPAAGQLADSREKSGMIRKLKAVEFLLMAVASFGFIAGYYPLLVVILFLMGVQSAFFGPIKYSILPQLLEDNELVAATALVELGTFSAILLGTIIGGVCAAIPDTGAYWISGLMTIFALIGWKKSLSIKPIEQREEKLEISLNPFPAISESFSHMRKEISVFYSVMAISWFWFYGAALLSILPVYTRDTLSGSEHLATLFLAAFTIGIGAGSVLCEKISPGRLETGIIPIGAIGLTIFPLAIFFAGTPAYDIGTAIGATEFLSTLFGLTVFLCFLLLSLSGGLFIVPLYTLLQKRTGDDDRSRVIAGNNIVNALFMVCSALLVMFLFSIKVSVPAIFGIIAELNLFACIIIFIAVPEFPSRLKKMLFGGN